MREILFFEEFMMITLVYKFHVYNITFLLLLFIYFFSLLLAPTPLRSGLRFGMAPTFLLLYTLQCAHHQKFSFHLSP